MVHDLPADMYDLLQPLAAAGPGRAMQHSSRSCTVSCLIRLFVCCLLAGQCKGWGYPEYFQSLKAAQQAGGSGASGAVGGQPSPAEQQQVWLGHRAYAHKLVRMRFTALKVDVCAMNPDGQRVSHASRKGGTGASAQYTFQYAYCCA